MDSAKFDYLTKYLWTSSRRSVIRVLFGIILAPAALSTRGARAAASCIEGGAGPCTQNHPEFCCSFACGTNGECLLDPGQQCKQTAQCGRASLGGTQLECKKVSRKSRRKECFCGDGRRACTTFCCDPGEVCERHAAVPGCLPETGRVPGTACSSSTQCQFHICTTNICRCSDGRLPCGAAKACCNADQICQKDLFGDFSCVDKG
jgi:hypothetical protein